MKRTDVIRKFIEAIIRLRRDSLNFIELGIQSKIELNLSNEFNKIIIGFNPTTKLWSLHNDEIFFDEWNPKLNSDDLSFLDNFDESELLNAIDKMDMLTKLAYNDINAKSLESKFQQIMNLMRYEENNIEPLPKIDIDKVSIWFDFDDNEFKLSDIVNNIRVEGFLSDFELKYLLENSKYLDIKNALGKCFLMLNRKK
jgi:hypothetical protein